MNTFNFPYSVQSSSLFSDQWEFTIPDNSLVGGKVPECITSTTKDNIIIVFFIPIDKNIVEYKVCEPR